ncbi:MAG TPA: carboxypeptidase regulatory-like domain-containing protein [Acidobacteriaceae bacterium]|jgi:hypothetical protein
MRRNILTFLIAAGVSLSMAMGQATSTNGGSIQGTITDPSGAAIPGATIVISNPATGYTHSLTTDSAGFYSLGPLVPGNYSVMVTAANFQRINVSTVVRTGTATSGNEKLAVGNSSETIEVNAAAVQVNTDQPSVSDVITSDQIKTLPVNGRNFLDLAQIEPGVILQSGESFDPTKAGYSAISVSGVSGRTTRILLDGQDITDETVGTTIFNVSQGAINDFQLNRSTQDVSGDVTSTGQVLVTTNSGTNAIHGQLFGQFQDYRAGFANGPNALNPPFQRNQFGGSVGGPILKDKLFFFGNSERIKQDSGSAANLGTLFAGSIGASHPTVPSPYRETYSTVRLDYNGPHGIHMFARGNYNVNSVASNFGDGYWLYANRDNTPGLAGGVDFAAGRFTHSFRGSYEKFHNLIADSTAGNSSIYNGIPGYAFYFSAQHLFSGPNYLAPQGTFQSDKQIRYDGTWTRGAHTFKYGYSVNYLLGGGFAAFFGLSPRTSITAATQFKGGTDPVTGNPLPGCNGTPGAAACPNDPLNGYFPGTTYIGNGQGFFTENPGFGLQGGGVHDWRQGIYVADSWKIVPSFTLTLGLRWSVDTDRANQDLATPLCSDVDTSSVATPCTSGSTPLFSLWRSDLTQGHVNQPYKNFAPQVGFNFSPGNHKTSVRAAFGIFYEGDVFNNTTNARNALLKQGAFFDDRNVCNGTYSVQSFPGMGSTPLTTVDGLTLTQICALPLSQAAPHLIHLEQQYQTATKANSSLANGAFVGETLIADGVYAPNYRTPYSEQWNGGIQRELWKGTVLSADYVHNSTLKIAQSIDTNHVGAARYLNTAAAQNAVKNTVALYPACPQGFTAASINCAIASGAKLATFAGKGLDSGRTYLGSSPASAAGKTPATGAAFSGANPALGSGEFLLPIGRSGYDALQVVLRQSSSHPVPGINHADFQVSYNLSRIVTNSSAAGSSDEFFSTTAWDFDNPSAYMGRASLDHTHQLSFGGTLSAKYGARIGVLAHFESAAPGSLVLDSTNGSGTAAGAIFTTDLTGDGTTADLAPGTSPGAYMHSVKGNNLASYISNYNATQAGKLTPAGQALVSAGLFNQAQLAAIGAVTPTVATLPQPTALNNPTFRALDMNLAYPISLKRFREGFSLEPGIAFYNVFNMSNFTNFSTTLLNTNSGATSGYVVGPSDYPTLNANRTQRGSGTFDQGGPRSTEFSLKLNF